jgi:hypothetical protein
MFSKGDCRVGAPKHSTTRVEILEKSRHFVIL